MNNGINNKKDFMDRYTEICDSILELVYHSAAILETDDWKSRKIITIVETDGKEITSYRGLFRPLANTDEDFRKKYERTKEKIKELEYFCKQIKVSNQVGLEERKQSLDSLIEQIPEL